MKFPRSLIAFGLTFTIACTQDPAVEPQSSIPPNVPSEPVPPPGPSLPEVNLPPGLPGPGIGACDYVNPFSKGVECKQYTGSSWDETAARENCDRVFAGEAGEFTLSGKCQVPNASGVCWVGQGKPEEYYTLQGGEASLCNTLAAACKGFAQGIFLAVPGGPCDSGEPPPPPAPGNGSLQPEAVLAMRSDAVISVSPKCDDEDCVAQLAEDKQAIMFTPLFAVPTRGLIIYPGGGVDPRAYAVAANEIARAGYLVALVVMPSNLAVNGVDRAQDIITENPDIRSWTIAGHSLGGVAAAKFVSTHQDAVDGIAMWASYPDENTDLSGLDIKGVTIYGTSDPRSTPEQILGSLPKLPTETMAAPIRSGNHSYFAWAGVLDGDIEAELISQKQQSDLVIGATLHLMARVEAGGSDLLSPGFEMASTLEATEGCASLQQQIAGFSESGLPRSDIALVNQEKFRDFWSADKSLPSVTSTATPRVRVYQYTKQLPNPSDINAPPIIDGELFCKVKSQEAIIDALGSEAPAPETPPKNCHSQSTKAYDWAASVVDEDTRSAATNWTLEVEPDTVYPSGPAFVLADSSYVKVLPGSTARSTKIQSPTFRAGLDQDTWGRGAGNTYCKALSYQNALWRIYARARDGAEPWTSDSITVEDGPLVISKNQTVDNGQVTVEQVVHAVNGFIIIHEDYMGRAGVPIGQSELVPAGIQENVTATLIREVRDGEVLHAMLHIDGNQNGVYDTQGNVDGPVEDASGRVVMAPFVVRAE